MEGQLIRACMTSELHGGCPGQKKGVWGRGLARIELRVGLRAWASRVLRGSVLGLRVL